MNRFSSIGVFVELTVLLLFFCSIKRDKQDERTSWTRKTQRASPSLKIKLGNNHMYRCAARNYVFSDEKYGDIRKMMEAAESRMCACDRTIVERETRA